MNGTVCVIELCGMLCVFISWYCLAGRQITKATVIGVKYTFPEKYITPAQFRRIIPTEAFDQEIWTDYMTQEDFMELLALLMNTSANVSET